MSNEPWFEFFRLGALSLIYAGFVIQVCSIHYIYRLFRRWTADEAERRERWIHDIAALDKLREGAAKQLEESGHLRIMAEIALAQARKHLPENRPQSTPNGAFPNRGYERTES